ncbi:MAG: hypothetical protein K2N98_03960, partial [Lachnospiraceae bacterium]|nr:hypothetical protein [Lachnospiraceae bacterium]
RRSGLLKGLQNVHDKKLSFHDIALRNYPVRPILITEHRMDSESNRPGRGRKERLKNTYEHCNL